MFHSNRWPMMIQETSSTYKLNCKKEWIRRAVGQKQRQTYLTQIHINTSGWTQLHSKKPRYLESRKFIATKERVQCKQGNRYVIPSYRISLSLPPARHSFLCCLLLEERWKESLGFLVEAGNWIEKFL